MVLSLPGLLLASGVCRSEEVTSVWSEWATSPFAIRGPEEADGLLLYLHEEGLEDQPVALVFVEMARVAQWDVLRINRRPFANHEANDSSVLEFVSERIDHVRRMGYGRVVVGGISRGGWLALSAATLPGVDAVISLAPGTTDFDQREERTRIVPVHRLAAARAKRVAVFFFEGDSHPDMAEHGTAAVRRALQGTGSSFMVVDRPADLPDRSAASGGRFTRRYRDCLVQFAQDVAGRAGEVQCSRSSGYAVGDEIGFPAPDPALRKLPATADPAFGPFWGRWEGDDEHGAYMILQAVDVRLDGIVLRIGLSSGPGNRYPFAGVSEDLAFQIDGSRTCLYYRFPRGDDILAVRLKSESELEYEGQRGRNRSKFRIRLRKHAADTYALPSLPAGRQ